MQPLEPTPGFDLFWKDGLDLFLPDFIALAAPDLFDSVAWTRGFRAIESELAPSQPDDAIGTRTPDRVFEVRMRSGAPALLLVHVEIQAEPRRDFARRMFVYRYRLFDRRDVPVFSIAILADESNSFRPTEFVEACYGTEIRFRFRTVKLLDFRGRIAELESSSNPFAFLIAIHLRTRETKPDRRRLAIKSQLLRTLVARRWSRLRITQLTKLLAWLMIVPPELEQEFRREVIRLEEDRNMQIITTFELEAMERGRAEAQVTTKREDVVRILRARFKAIPDRLRARIVGIASVDRLDRLIELAATSATLNEFEERVG